MSVNSKLANRAPKLIQTTGVLLVVLGVVHLIATPFLVGWVSRQFRSEDVALATAAIRLNHILVGILLIPLGLSTFWAGKSLEQFWALRLAAVNAATLLCFPVLLITTMPLESLDAPLFRLAILVVIAACLVQILALVGVWRSRWTES